MSDRETDPNTASSAVGAECPAGPSRPAARDFVAPRNETEEAVAEILSGLLEGERVGAEDNFILRGGESLRAAQAARRIWDRFGCEVALRTILVGTVANIAEEISAASSSLRETEAE